MAIAVDFRRLACALIAHIAEWTFPHYVVLRVLITGYYERFTVRDMEIMEIILGFLPPPIRQRPSYFSTLFSVMFSVFSAFTSRQAPKWVVATWAAAWDEVVKVTSEFLMEIDAVRIEDILNVAKSTFKHPTNPRVENRLCEWKKIELTGKLIKYSWLSDENEIEFGGCEKHSMKRPDDSLKKFCWNNDVK